MDNELMIKYIRKKDEKGIEMLIDDYRGIITSIVRKHLGVLSNYEEECISDVLMSVWDNIKSYDKNKNTFKNWVCAIAKYKAIDYKRKYLKKMETVDLDKQIYYVDTELIRLEIEEEIKEILSYLNEEDKELFIKHYIEGEDLESIAIRSNKKVSNIYNRLSRGRKKIRENVYK